MKARVRDTGEIIDVNLVFIQIQLFRTLIGGVKINKKLIIQSNLIF